MEKKRREEMKAMYPGSFDPITLGHLDVIRRAAKMVSTLYVVVMRNPAKKYFFTTKERMKLVKESTKDIENVVVDMHDGLLVDYAKKKEINVVIRGLRAVTDFEFELQMANANRQLLPGLETVFFMTDEKYSFISSTLVREVATLGGDISQWVPEPVIMAFKDKIRRD